MTKKVFLANQFLFPILIEENDFKPIWKNQAESDYAHELADKMVAMMRTLSPESVRWDVFLELSHAYIDAYYRLDETGKAAMAKLSIGNSDVMQKLLPDISILQQLSPKIILLKEKPGELVELIGPLMLKLLEPLKSIGVSLSIMYAELDIDSLSPEASAALVGILMITRQDDKAMELWRTSNKINRTSFEELEKYFIFFAIEGKSLYKEGDFLGAESEFRDLLVFKYYYFSASKSMGIYRSGEKTR